MIEKRIHPNLKNPVTPLHQRGNTLTSIRLQILNWNHVKKSIHGFITVLVLLLLSSGCVHYPKPNITQNLENLIVMKTSKPLVGKADIGQLKICKELYSYYQDVFDIIIIVSNVPYEKQDFDETGYFGAMFVVRNSVVGTGVTLFDKGKHFGSDAKLKGVLHLTANNFILRGPTLHEIMHLWSSDVEIIPTVNESHWGFSDVNGQLGGFDREELKVLGENRYSAGSFFTNANGGNTVPYSPLELYLAGWIAPQQVPDIWVLEDGRWLLSESGSIEEDIDGHDIFIGEKISHWTIQKIINRIGNRIPNFEASQRTFEVAVILVENDRFPATSADLELVSRHVELFSRKDSIRSLQQFEKIFNFWEATGGRASINVGPMQQFLLPVSDDR